MGGGTLYDGAEGDQGVVLAGGGEAFEGEGLLECARHPRDGDVGGRGAVAGQAVEGSLEQLPREEVVEAAGDDAEAEAFGVEHSGVFLAVHAVLLSLIR